MTSKLFVHADRYICVPDVLAAYEGEIVRLHEHRDLMLVIADQVKVIEALQQQLK